MLLDELKKPAGAGAPYLGQLTDALGDAHYELAVSGAPKLVKQVFGKAELEYEIHPKATEADSVLRAQKLWAQVAEPGGGATERETIAALDEKMPDPAKAKDSVVLSVRRTEGQGTFWWFALAGVFMTPMKKAFFVLPPICNCAAAVFPSSGSPNLFLSANGPSTPFIALSISSGLATRRVSFGPAVCFPWQEFVPWFMVSSGFTNVTFTFVMSGFGVIP